MSLSDETLGEFISECEDIIQRMSENLALVEKGEHTMETIDAIYRDMHTLKGTSYLFGFSHMGRLAHAMETALDPLRKLEKAIRISSDFLDACFKSLDVLELTKNQLKENKKDENCRSDIDRVFYLLVERASHFFGIDFGPSKDFMPSEEDLIQLKKDLAKQKMVVAPDQSLEVKNNFNEIKEKINKNEVEDDAEKVKKPLLSVDQLREESYLSNNVNKEYLNQERVMSDREEEQLPEMPENTMPNSALSQNAENNAKDHENKNNNFSGETVRVQVELLDRLMNLAGELVLVRNQVLQFSSRSENLELLNLSQNLNIVTSDLQEEVMKTRMQPVGNVLNKFQRIVRDIARDIGKKIEIHISGAETELDKTLLEAIKDPLTHIVRNSCDHGLEFPDERRAASKSELGNIFIKAFHEGGQVVVEISDDGRGLNRDKIIKKAIQKELITSQQAEVMGEREMFQLIFLPGFSTAEKVSSVSGRGVGMDVVKTNIEKIGGNVELESKSGKGTSLRLKIPLTLAIVPAMLVRSGTERYAIPQVKLVELVRVDNLGGDSHTKIDFLHGNPLYRLRGNLLPLVSLHRALAGKNLEVETLQEELQKKDTINIAVLSAEGHFFGLIVDEILDTADIVVKPLSQFLKSLSTFSGATIMGDGSVALILDVNGISQNEGLESKSKENNSMDVMAGGKGNEKVFSDSMEMLLFDATEKGRFAIPLCLVNRLEEFPLSHVEYSGEQKVVQYRGSILPIISLVEYLNLKKESSPEDQVTNDSISVIVTAKANRYFGIQVQSILDVIMVNQQVDDSIKDRKGILGNVVINEEVVGVIDVLDIMDMAIKKLCLDENHKDKNHKNDSHQDKYKEETPAPEDIRVLIAEDTAFFRRQLKKLLTSQGFDVVTADDGQEAIEILNSSKAGEFNLLVSDIEMPRLNGFELATQVRASNHFTSLPMIAVTTRFKQRDIDRGKEVGFNLYLEKLNEQQLLNGVSSLLNRKTGS